MKESLKEQFSQLKQGMTKGLGDEGLQILINIAGINAVVIPENQLKNFLIQLESLKELSETPERFQMLVSFNDGKYIHYSTIDIKLQNNNCECIVLDSNNSPQCVAYVQALLDLRNKDGSLLFNHVYLPIAHERYLPQSDFYSCPIFSLDYAVQVSKLDIYDYIKSKCAIPSEQRGVALTWNDMPHQLIWNTQSYTWLNQYKELNKVELSQGGKGAELDKYLAAGKTTKWDMMEERPVNSSTTRLFEQYKALGDQFIENKTEPELVKITELKPTLPLHKHEIDHEQVKSSSTPLKIG